MGSSNSGTAVWRPQQNPSSITNPPPGAQPDMVAALVQQARQNQGSASGAQDRSLGLITLYSNGFIVGNGAFRDRSEPANARFLERLKAGEVPEELEEICRKEWNLSASGEVSVNLVDKSGETYVPPKKAFDFASSQGQSLGGSSSSGAAAASFANAQPRRLAVDSSQPTTTLQLVLSDRKKVRETANHTTTVMQLYEHVMSLSGVAGFELVAGFPPKPLTQPQLTLKEAGLLGAAVQQR